MSAPDDKHPVDFTSPVKPLAGVIQFFNHDCQDEDIIDVLGNMGQMCKICGTYVDNPNN